MAEIVVAGRRERAAVADRLSWLNGVGIRAREAEQGGFDGESGFPAGVPSQFGWLTSLAESRSTVLASRLEIGLLQRSIKGSPTESLSQSAIQHRRLQRSDDRFLPHSCFSERSFHPTSAENTSSPRRAGESGGAPPKYNTYDHKDDDHKYDSHKSGYDKYADYKTSYLARAP
ncbi:hypothetical protein BDK51DRAFT_31390 [Blyttiomyces helicus]|uniref:Uncharacterized protein n=1 Tax=Blyttiomyces helicus TaxID=388810 RepID=A0A4P9W6G9_9FUNG|nr:hypothetical protein BDK51DRAFT_31390 [Blyttiomyces helicus]|eukprot:RKO86340.1 hypothetical protein BDK51DRAFT_31390 [Blyttiomyces helicus]